MNYTNSKFYSNNVRVNTVRVTTTQVVNADCKHLYYKKYMSASATDYVLNLLYTGTDVTVHCNGNIIELKGANYFVPQYKYAFNRMQELAECNKLLAETVETRRGKFTVEQLYGLWKATKTKETKTSLQVCITRAVDASIKRGVDFVNRKNLLGYSKRLNLLTRFIYTVETQGKCTLFFNKKLFKFANLARLSIKDNTMLPQTTALSDAEKLLLSVEMEKYCIEIQPMYGVQYLVEGDFTADLLEFSEPKINVYTGYSRKTVSISGAPEELNNFKYAEMRYKEFIPESQYTANKEATAWLAQHTEFIDHTKYGICPDCGNVYELKKGCRPHMLPCTAEELTALRHGCTGVYSTDLSKPNCLRTDPYEQEAEWYDRYTESISEEEYTDLSSAKRDRLFYSGSTDNSMN